MSFIPGWNPGFNNSVSEAGLTSFALQASSTSTGTTITAPSDINSGDLLVIHDHALNAYSTLPTAVTPSGFTNILNIPGSWSPGFTRVMLSAKIADGTEASQSFTGMNGNFSDAKIFAVFRGDVALSSFADQDTDSQFTSGNPTSQTVTASGGTVPLIVFGVYGSDDGAVSPRTMSPAKDDELNVDVYTYLAWKIYLSSPADVSVDMDDEGDANTLGSCYLELST